MKKVIYIAGPMRGLPDFNYQMFNSVARMLRSDGWDVVNPVEIGEEFGSPYTIQGNPEILQIVTNLELDIVDKKSDAIYLLPGWENSIGSRKELSVALKKNLEIIIHGDYMSWPIKYTPEKQDVTELK